ncbi:OsmC family protein [Nocardioides flavescens]|uniref:OsmC family peroxiredoxin n=1 Tax=Nocardioides flavescens TaxID=2691959 RepID=A0A6L7EYX5_9ACTN|nr:OsmC family protein [Nocardioides flavescens]MXG90878.1 OsmC family peroxiredoxin [Nocardioides flavescens]
MPTVPFSVASRGTGVAQDVTVQGEHEHHFSSDTYPAFGGADAAPSPLAYTLGALTSCNQISAQLVAKDLDIRVGEFTFTARGDLDPSVFVGGVEGNANFDAVTVEATVETDAEGERFDRFVAELERRCPVTQLFRRSGLDYTSTWKSLPLPE